jgi:hypothetical protein
VTARAKRVMHDGRDAPSLPVAYECPKCGLQGVRDAYAGPPTCNGDPAHPPRFMIPLRFAVADEGGD